jgi:hypothetical protein
MGVWHFGGESPRDDEDAYVTLPIQGPVQQNGPHFSCSLCRHFTSEISNLCNVNPEVVKRRITYDGFVNIFCCDLTIVCNKFERDYNKQSGYIKE